MIDINLLYELTVFEKCGTLSKAAEELSISQPALSRSMNRLEEESETTVMFKSLTSLEIWSIVFLKTAYALHYTPDTETCQEFFKNRL